MDFEKAIDHILGFEGAFTKDPDDVGNWTGGAKGKGVLKGTNWGISAASYPKLDISKITRAEAILIYKKDFWDKNKIESLPDIIRLHFFDVCVNSGYTRAVKILQLSLRVTADGILGANTRRQMQNITPWEYAEKRVLFYVNIVKTNPVNIKYLTGWIIRVLEVTEHST